MDPRRLWKILPTPWQYFEFLNLVEMAFFLQKKYTEFSRVFTQKNDNLFASYFLLSLQGRRKFAEENSLVVVKPRKTDKFNNAYECVSSNKLQLRRIWLVTASKVFVFTRELW